MIDYQDEKEKNKAKNILLCSCIGYRCGMGIDLYLKRYGIMQQIVKDFQLKEFGVQEGFEHFPSFWRSKTTISFDKMVHVLVFIRTRNKREIWRIVR